MLSFSRGNTSSIFSDAALSPFLSHDVLRAYHNSSVLINSVPFGNGMLGTFTLGFFLTVSLAKIYDRSTLENSSPIATTNATPFSIISKSIILSPFF